MTANLMTRYRAALNKAESTEKLKCHVIAIKKTIEALEAGAEPTTLDVVWVDYFLNINKRETIPIYQTEDRAHFCLEKIDNSGRYDSDADCSCQYYELPPEYYIEKAWGRLRVRQYGTSHQVEIVRGKDNLPELAVFNKPRTSKNYRVKLTQI